MSTFRKDPVTGRRSIQVEVEVPGSVEEVWAAIATGPGVTAWFAPTEIVEKDGEKIVETTLAPGMTIQARQTLWDPPHRFVGEAEMGPGAPAIAAEWSVEAKDGGTCVVRVVHSLFASTDDWDDQLTGAESGWPGYFRVLTLYLRHFAGQTCSPISVMAVKPVALADAWDAMTSTLPVAGAVEYTGSIPGASQLILLVDDPGPGVVRVYAREIPGGLTMVAANLYLYGPGAAEIAARDQSLWETWVQGLGSAKAT
jgi:uncharacterized protein YndB with AHSA1/START domain